jgi:hypothetical protein
LPFRSATGLDAERTSKPSLQGSFNCLGERVEIDRAAPHGDSGEVTEKRCVRPLATLVRCDAGDLEDGANFVLVELELGAWKSRHGGDRITRLLQPRVHPAILSEWHATRT